MLSLQGDVEDRQLRLEPLQGKNRELCYFTLIIEFYLTHCSDLIEVEIKELIERVKQLSILF